MSDTTLLPIDVIPNVRPLLFKWKYRLAEGVLQECQGSMPASAEGAVANLIEYTKVLQRENDRLRAELEKATKKTK